jgi:uncharacterized protein
MTAAPIVPDVAIRAARALAEAATSPARILLFGSYARGTAVDGSDLDFLVIQETVENSYRETVRLRQALYGYPLPIDIVVISAAEAAAPSSLAIREGLREGILLHEPAAV